MKQSSPIFFSAKAPPAVHIIQSVLTCILTYHHFDSQLSCYLSALLCTHQTSRTLQPSSEKLMKIPNCNLKSFGEHSKHSFSFIAPSVWNSLPASLWSLPTLSEFKTQDFPFSTALYTNLGGQCFCVEIMCMNVCTYAWIMCISALSFLAMERYAIYKRHPFLLLLPVSPWVPGWWRWWRKTRPTAGARRGRPSGCGGCRCVADTRGWGCWTVGLSGRRLCPSHSCTRPEGCRCCSCHFACHGESRFCQTKKVKMILRMWKCTGVRF